MARKPATRVEFTLFDLVYEDGSQRSNRRVPSEALGGLDGDAPARAIIEEQDRLIAEKSGVPAIAVKSIHRSSSKKTRRSKEAATLPNHSKERDEAEARFKRAQKATQDPTDTEARAPYEAEAWAVREKTARLKALRLDKEATDLRTRGDKKPITSKATPSI